MELVDPVTKAINDQLSSGWVVCIGCVATSGVVQELFILFQIHLIICHAIDTPMAENVWIDIRALCCVIVHNIQDDFNAFRMKPAAKN